MGRHKQIFSRPKGFSEKNKLNSKENNPNGIHFLLVAIYILQRLFTCVSLNKQNIYHIAPTDIDVLNKNATAFQLKNREAFDLIAGAIETVKRLGGKLN